MVLLASIYHAVDSRGKILKMKYEKAEFTSVMVTRICIACSYKPFDSRKVVDSPGLL